MPSYLDTQKRPLPVLGKDGVPSTSIDTLLRRFLEARFFACRSEQPMQTRPGLSPCTRLPARFTVRTCSAGKRPMSGGAHCPAMRSSSACTNSLHCSAGVSRRPIARRTSSSNGASGMSSVPRTPPLFLMAVRMSSSVSSLRARSRSG